MFSRLLRLAAVVLLLTVIVHCSLYDALGNRELVRMKERNKILHDKLISEKCPAPDSVMLRRSLLEVSEDGLRLEVEEELHGKLLGMLIKCRKEKIPPTTTVMIPTTIPTTIPSTTTTTSIPSTTTTIPSTTETTPSTTTMSTTTTAVVIQPTECQKAINLTESWRMDNKGSIFKPKEGYYNCDTGDMKNAGRPWFRFTGAAGSRLLNTCPPTSSCGTIAGIWSDESMPGEVGVVKAITAYGSYTSGCKEFSESVSVMRCSLALNDFVYRYEGNRSCYLGFCGMN